MPYGITQCYLPPDRGENRAFTPFTFTNLATLDWRDARLSWPMLRGSWSAGNWTHNLE